MKAVILEKHGSPDVLKYKDIESPLCESDKIKIRVKSASINHLDLWVRSGIPGMNFNLPMIMGSDGAGVIEEIGKDVKDYNIGDDVVIQPGIYDSNCKLSKRGDENFSPSYGILGETQNGVQSDYVCLDPMHVYKMPSSLSYTEISSMPLTFMTSYQMLFERAQLLDSDILLVYGGTSGVGSAAIQIAKDYGCKKIISTVGSNKKIKYVEDLGADAVFIHDKKLYYNIKDYLGKDKVDIVFEHIGKKTWDTSIKLLNKGGKIVTCGATTGSNVGINLTHIFFKQLSILGSTMSNIKSFESVLKKIENGKYKPLIDSIFPISDIIDAHIRIENRENIGKVVLDLS